MLTFTLLSAPVLRFNVPASLPHTEVHTYLPSGNGGLHSVPDSAVLPALHTRARGREPICHQQRLHRLELPRLPLPFLLVYCW